MQYAKRVHSRPVACQLDQPGRALGQLDVEDQRLLEGAEELRRQLIVRRVLEIGGQSVAVVELEDRHVRVICAGERLVGATEDEPAAYARPANRGDLLQRRFERGGERAAAGGREGEVICGTSVAEGGGGGRGRAAASPRRGRNSTTCAIMIGVGRPAGT